MKNFGIRMSGLELEIENLFINYLCNLSTNSFKYLEIGAASCTTLKAIHDIVKNNVKHDDWEVIGVDIENGYSVDWKEIRKLFKDNELEVYTNRVTNRRFPAPKAKLFIDKNPRELVTNNFYDIDICFIDACHGYKCVTEDFHTVQNNIKPNGIVFFHDTSILEQGTDFQEHCKEFINVRKALSDMGLFDNKHPNWKFEREVLGSRFFGGDGNGISIFRKTL